MEDYSFNNPFSFNIFETHYLKFTFIILT